MALSSPVPIHVQVDFASLGAVLTQKLIAPAGVGVSSVYYPFTEQLEVFFVGNDGAVYVVWKAQNQNWQAAVPLTVSGFATPGAPLASVFYPLNNQLEVFVADVDGAINVLWKAQNDLWNAPVALTAPGAAPARAPLAAAYYPLGNQLEVLFVGPDGTLNLLWKTENGPWNPLVGLTGPNAAPSGAALALVYQPLNEQLEAFFVDAGGALNVAWKAQNGPWNAPVVLSGNVAPPGASVSAVFQPLGNQLEVFVVDNTGALNLMWKAENSAWNAPIPISAPGFAPAGGGLSAAFYPTNNQLEVLLIGNDGAWYVIWKAQNGPWNAPVGLSIANLAPPGAQVSVTAYPLNAQLEAFVLGSGGDVNLAWKAQNGIWSAPTGVLAWARAVKLANANGTLTPTSLAEAIAGQNLNDDAADIVMTINTNVMWHASLDAVVPADRTDLFSVVMHEIGHGLGFDASTCMAGDSGCDATVMGQAAFTENGSEVVPYTQLLETQSGVRLDSMTQPSIGLATALTSGQIFWGGPAATAAGGGQRPRLFAPPNWSPGSSISHLDNATYPAGDPDALMTPSIGTGENARELGAVTVAMTADLGWPLRDYASPPAANSTWAAYQPLNEQLEVFTIGDDGALSLRWKAYNSAWNEPVELAPPGAVDSTAHLAAVFQSLNDQLEVLYVTPAGSIHLVWKAQNEAWHTPVPLTANDVVPPGTTLAGVFQPLNNQLEVFFIDWSGAVNVLWKAQNGQWQAPVRLTASDLAPPGGAVAASFYPLNDQLEVFFIDNAGALNVVWKAQNGSWNPPAGISGALAPPGSPLTVSFHPPNNQLEVLGVNEQGEVWLAWKAQNEAWHTPVSLLPAGTAYPYSWLASAFYPVNNQLEVMFVDTGGAIRLLWKANNGPWSESVALTADGTAAAGAPVALSYYPLGSQLEGFVRAPDGSLLLMWKTLNGRWRGPVPLN
jgi:hypothetical protein